MSYGTLEASVAVVAGPRLLCFEGRRIAESRLVFWINAGGSERHWIDDYGFSGFF